MEQLEASIEQVKREKGITSFPSWELPCDCLVGQCKGLETVGCQRAALTKEVNRMTTQTQQLDTMAGKVTQIAVKDGNATGLKLEGREGEWINISVPQYRGHFEMPTQGDHVKLGVSRSPKDNRLWAKTCEIQKRGNGPQSTYDDGQVPAGGRDLSIMRQVCLKAAAEIVSARMAHIPFAAEAEPWTAVVGIDVLALAQDFERWLIRGDPPFA